MPGQVIQGFFGGGRRPVVPTAVPTSALPLQRRAAAPGGERPAPGPPASAFLHADGQSVQRRAAPGRPPLVHATAALPGDGRTLQRFGGDGSFAVDPTQIGLVQSGGKPLPQALLAKMEAAFGADFSGVRVHVGPQASRIGALAFTTGQDLYFAPGQFQPDSAKGQQLIGHELAHVIQQRQGRVRAPGSGVAVVQDRTLEAEADRMGMRAAGFRAPSALFGFERRSASQGMVAQRSADGSYFSATPSGFTAKPKSRPTNQSAPSTQQKMARRFRDSDADLPPHYMNFADDVLQNDKADLAGTKMDICHVTPVDEMKNTIASTVDARDTLTTKEKRKFEDTLVETLSSDDEDDRKQIRKKARTMLDPNVSERERVAAADWTLNRCNRGTRNLRPAHRGPNRGIGNARDPIIVNKRKESRSDGIGKSWNKLGEVTGRKKNMPKTKMDNGQQLIKSSDIHPRSGKAFGKVKGTFEI